MNADDCKHPPRAVFIRPNGAEWECRLCGTVRTLPPLCVMDRPLPCDVRIRLLRAPRWPVATLVDTPRNLPKRG